MPVYGGEAKNLCYNGCSPGWSPDAASLYLRIGFQPAGPVLVVPLPSGRAFPEFPVGPGDALTSWRKLPAAHVIERPASIPGLDEGTYIVTKVVEHRNLFRIPLTP